MLLGPEFLAEVAEWQTQTTQNRPGATPWEFESPLRHKLSHLIQSVTFFHFSYPLATDGHGSKVAKNYLSTNALTMSSKVPKARSLSLRLASPAGCMRLGRHRMRRL